MRTDETTGETGDGTTIAVDGETAPPLAQDASGDATNESAGGWPTEQLTVPLTAATLARLREQHGPELASWAAEVLERVALFTEETKAVKQIDPGWGVLRRLGAPEIGLTLSPFTVTPADPPRDTDDRTAEVLAVVRALKPIADALGLPDDGQPYTVDEVVAKVADTKKEMESWRGLYWGLADNTDKCLAELTRLREAERLREADTSDTAARIAELEAEVARLQPWPVPALDGPTDDDRKAWLGKVADALPDIIGPLGRGGARALAWSLRDFAQTGSIPVYASAYERGRMVGIEEQRQRMADAVRNAYADGQDSGRRVAATTVGAAADATWPEIEARVAALRTPDLATILTHPTIALAVHDAMRTRYVRPFTGGDARRVALKLDGTEAAVVAHAGKGLYMARAVGTNAPEDLPLAQAEEWCRRVMRARGMVVGEAGKG